MRRPAARQLGGEGMKTITIATAGGRTATRWQNKKLHWDEFTRLLADADATNISSETHAEYLAMPKDQQSWLKDVGGFVGGELQGGRRRHGSCNRRSLITLDMDNCAPGSTADWLEAIRSMGVATAVYTTRKHDSDHPRLRAIFPTDRDLTPDEYQPAARALAAMIDPDMAVWDPTTFEVERLMYWPSRSADAEAFLHYTLEDDPNFPPVSADELLGWYADWRDFAQWPRCKGEDAREHSGAKQADPTTKDGLVGAFCRAYDIPAAIATFLPEVYIPAGDNRYTYAAGSTTGGAVVYDDGKYLYSHHATDPAGGQLLNAWDLVRVHRFGDLDKGTAPGTAPGDTPSWQAMRQLATKDPKAGQLYNDETAAAAADAHSLDGFSPVDTSESQGADDQPADAPQPDDGKWREQLTCNSKGAIACTTQNAWLILEHDPKTAGRIWMDTFSERLRCKGPLPWPGATGERDWTDADDAGARWYLETVYHLSGTSKVQDAVSLTGSNHARDPVREYLEGLKWDGQPRLDTLFIDYLGAEDTEYTRAVTRKMFVAAVRRAFIPGCKFDQICILSGIQGIGKDTLLSRMGRQWYNDSITSFDGKDAREALRGVWIVELGEMNAFNRSEIEAAKQFLSQTEDRYRAAYGRRSVAYPRRCVFFGTSNVDDYLRDATGNRRYWPIDCEKEDPANTKKNVYNDLTPSEVDQIWAEAVVRHQAGEALILTGELYDAAIAQQDAHREADSWEGQIADFLDKPIPTDWENWDTDRRRLWWQGQCMDADQVKTRPRDQVCVAEIWAECFGQGARIEPKDSRRIGAILSSTPGWVRKNTNLVFRPYGSQRAWIRRT